MNDFSSEYLVSFLSVTHGKTSACLLLYIMNIMSNLKIGFNYSIIAEREGEKKQ
jgi:hypothetical protein